LPETLSQGIVLYLLKHGMSTSVEHNKIFEKKIGILGLGHVGLTLGLVFARAGFTVRGFDINPKVQATLKAGKPHFEESGLPELLKAEQNKRFFVVDDFSGKNACDIYIMTTGTPLDPYKKPDFSSVISAAHTLGRVLKRGDLVVLRSTVPLGTTRDVVLPLLEKESGLARGAIKIAFAPERTIEGDALRELTALPQIVGGFDAASTKETEELFKTLTETVVVVNSLEEAEMVKLVNNTYRETMFSFANEISIIARRWGLDTKRVIQAANKGYARSQVPLPSPGVGGYCLTKDGYLLMEGAERKGFTPHLVHQARYVSAYMLDSLAEEILQFVRTHHVHRPKVKVGILGFAFKGKPATSDMRGSTTLTLIKRLKNLPASFELVGYDPHVSSEEIQGTGVTPRESVAEVIRDSHIVVVMNNNPLFADVSPEHFSLEHAPVLFYDTWGVNQPETFASTPHVQYRSL
jgi:nucleotide sugar dehydrogenase